MEGLAGLHMSQGDRVVYMVLPVDRWLIIHESRVMDIQRVSVGRGKAFGADVPLYALAGRRPVLARAEVSPWGTSDTVLVSRRRPDQSDELIISELT